jgi:hypothetical protein
MNQRAGRDGLNGLAEPHFVGEQGAFIEREMEHSLALIGKKRDEGFLRWMQSRLDTQFIIMPQIFPLAGQSPRFEPGRYFDRKSNFGRDACAKVVEGIFYIGMGQNSARVKLSAYFLRQQIHVALDPQRIALPVRHNVHPVGTSPQRLAVVRLGRVLNMHQHRFHMLAGAEAVDAKIGAGADETARGQIANLHLVMHAAGRVHVKVGKHRMIRRQIADARLFLPRPQNAPVDFILIARPPVMRGWQGNFLGLFLFCRNFTRGLQRHKAES